MTDVEMIFRVNYPNVVGEEFDGEMVVVNLDTGTYFSLMGSASDLWARMVTGARTADLIAELERRYDTSAVDLDGIVARFMQELQAHNLIVASRANTVVGSADSRAAQQRDGAGATGLVFQEPALEAFSDLQDILLLDPIHDVDEVGWPSAAVDPPSVPQ